MKNNYCAEEYPCLPDEYWDMLPRVCPHCGMQFDSAGQRICDCEFRCSTCNAMQEYSVKMGWHCPQCTAYVADESDKVVVR